MTRHAKLLLGGTAVALIGLGAAGAVARQGHGGWGGGHHGGFMGHGFGGPGMMRMCRGENRAEEMADHMIVRIEHRAKLTEAQKPAFDELKGALRSAAAKVQAACPAKPQPAQDGSRPPRPSPIERLANAEAMTAATLDAIKTVRPAAEKLYAALSDEQKASLTPDRRRGWWRHRGGDDERGRDRGPNRGPGRDDGDESLP
jgi:hypothetical protein